MLTPLEQRVLAAVQRDIPIVPQPYRQLAEAVGVDEQRFIDILADLCARGVVRRYGATLRHQKSGYAANAMTAWCVPEDKIASVGKIMAAHRSVTHCYRRDPAETWPYNLYTMIHGRSEDACRATARKLAKKTGVSEYRLLFSRRELKKTSMVYFPDLP
jgi:DNA-binding Lrp family transcriptional regulator